GTAVAIHNANVTATAQAQATLTAQQNIYNQATSGNPVVNDSLAKNSSLNCFESDSATSGGCVFAGGTYHAKILLLNYFEPCFARSSNFSNFTLQVQMTIFSGNDGGVMFRANINNGTFYRFDLTTDGSYKLYLYHDYTGK